MNRRLLTAGLGLVVSLIWTDISALSIQSDSRYTFNPAWARLPEGSEWGGSTSWITADGKGSVIVLVRTAPYFRQFTRDGRFVKAWGDDGLFQSAHSVTIDSQGFLSVM